MASLLETITHDESLARRLAEMKPDSKTLTLSVSGSKLELQHPQWARSVDGVRFDRVPSDGMQPNGKPVCVPPPAHVAVGVETPVGDDELSETLLLNGGLAIRDEGFVPRRKVISLGQSFEPSIGRSEIDSAGSLVEDIEYRLVGKLGSGGTAIVYQAHQRAIDREVAVKVLRPDLAIDPSSRQRFLTEARVIGSLDHPNVIALHDLCVDCDGHLFYAMKQVDGTSWDQQIDDLSVEENLKILLRVADAIRYAHSRGLVHRDIKPENVMLGRYGEALLADWGLAINVDAAPTTASNSLSHAIGGTPAYMAPEQAVGDIEHVTTRTDVYLLGGILYQILSGQPPHNGDSLLDCIHAAANNVIEPTDAEGELIDAAMKAMATSPADRYPSVEQFISAIADHRTHQESERLVRRASRRIWPESKPSKSDPNLPAMTATASRNIEIGDPYERFRAGEALLNEAIALWPENRLAIDTLKRLRLEFARHTAGQGDLDLALRLFEAAGEGNSEAAARVRRDRERREQVRQSQAKYSALFTHSPEAGMLLRFADGVVVEANQACLEMLGYGLDDLVGQTVAELSIWICPNRRKEFVATLERSGRADNFETRFLTRHDGRVIDVLISSRTVDVNGTEMLLSTIRDISQRRDAERNLEQSRRRLRDLQRLAGLGTWSFSPQTEAVVWSEESFRLAGRQRDLGEPTFAEFLDHIHPDDRQSVRQSVEDAVKNGASYQVTFRYRDDSGQYRELLTRGQPVVDAGGTTTEVYGILMIPKHVT